jgi:hypothetical protein
MFVLPFAYQDAVRANPRAGTQKIQSVTVRVYKKKKHTWTNDANLTIQRKISQRILDKPCSTFNQKEHKG